MKTTKRVMKTFLCLLLVLMVAISLFGCNGSSEENKTSETVENETGSSQTDDKSSDEAKKLRIGVSIQGYKGIFMQYIVAGIMDSVEKMDNIEVMFADAEDRADKQVGQVENFIAQSVDAIILNPVDKEASCAAVDVAVEAGIPIVTVNTQTSNQEKATAYAGSNDVEAGELQMQYIADELGAKGNVVILHGAMGHSAQVQRRIGYMNILEKYPDMKLLYEQSADWQTDKAMAIMENWLQMGERIDAVAANCDTMALGALNAIEAAGKTEEIVVMGMDAIPDALKSIKEGKMAGTLWQDGIGQGKAALDLAIKAAKGEQVQDAIIPFEVINQDNIDEYIKKAEERDKLNQKYRLK